MTLQKDTKRKREPKELNRRIGERCRHAREASCYTQEQLAERIGVSTQFLSDAERGVTGMSVSTIIRLCDVLSVSTDYLLLGQDSNGSPKDSLSMFSRIQNLSEQEQELVEEAANLMMKSFHLHKN